MTEEREKYLANISNEERAIRRVIREHKIRLCDSKEYITRFNGKPKPFDVALVYEEAKKDVRYYNSVIKSLKKQLPAPCKEMPIGKLYCMYECPICGETRIFAHSYCFSCGQKLR